MALSYNFYKEFNLVVLTGSGRVSAQEFKEYVIEVLCGDTRITEDYLELVDLRAVEVMDVTEGLAQDVAASRNLKKRPVPSKLAFVAIDDAVFGACRQYEAIVQHYISVTHVFRDIDEAKEWLGIEDTQID